MCRSVIRRNFEISSAPNQTISYSNTSMTHVLFNYPSYEFRQKNKFYHLDDGNTLNVSEFHKKNKFHTKV
jgi:hypothetical protein